MKKQKTEKLFVVLLAITLAFCVSVASVAASLGYFGKATMFRGRVEMLSVVTENPQIVFMTSDAGEPIGEYADVATDAPIDFPVLEKVEYFDGKWVDTVGGRSPIYASSFKICTEYGSAENLRCHLAVNGNIQLAPTVRVGLFFEYATGGKIATVLNGFNDAANTDISVNPYSADIGYVSADQPVKVTACIWVDKIALTEAGIYGDNEMEVSLVIY